MVVIALWTWAKLLAVAGKMIVNLEASTGNKSEFILENPNQGLYIPRIT